MHTHTYTHKYTIGDKVWVYDVFTDGGTYIKDTVEKIYNDHDKNGDSEPQYRIKEKGYRNESELFASQKEAEKYQRQKELKELEEQRKHLKSEYEDKLKELERI